jgi:hypothetical protein
VPKCVCLANLRTQIFGKPILRVREYEGMSAGCFVQFAEKRAVDLRLVLNETSIMSTLGPISGPRAKVAYNFIIKKINQWHDNP